MKTVVFLDRDGVINRNIDGDYVRHWQEFEFLPSSREAIQRLLRENTPVIVVCNQACIGKGLVSDATVQEINRRLVAKTSVADRRISAVYYCPPIGLRTDVGVASPSLECCSRLRQTGSSI